MSMLVVSYPNSSKVFAIPVEVANASTLNTVLYNSNTVQDNANENSSKSVPTVNSTSTQNSSILKRAQTVSIANTVPNSSITSSDYYRSNNIQRQHVTGIFKRTGPSCVAVGCSLRPKTNLLSTVKMVRFPQNLHRRRLWELAVRRANWKSTKSSVLCNRHFITGKPSADPKHPDYVPSIFEYNREERESKAKKNDRFKKKCSMC